jgi:acyl carrier protein
MKEKIKEIIADVFDIEIKKVKENMSQKNTETWDSLKHLNLIVSIEEEYSISFEPEEISDMNDFKAIINIVKKKIMKKK